MKTTCMPWIILGLFFSAAAALGGEFPTEEEIFRSLLPGTTNQTKGYAATRSLAGTRPADSEPSVTLRIQFKLNSAELTPEAVGPLQNLGRALQREELSGYVYSIEGHTCDLGKDAYNLELSRKRARTVRDFLAESFRVSADQLETVGFGERSPAVPNTNESARRQNRRVVIKNTLRTFAKNLPDGRNLSVTVRSLKDGRRSVLEDGETLTGEDNYAVEFASGFSGYVYIYQMDTKGEMSAIFPNPAFSNAANPVTSGRLYRFPDAGKWFFLDNAQGPEQIIVIAHPDPVEEPERICRNILAPAGDRGADPVMMASKTRGLQGVRPTKPTAETALALAPDAAAVEPETPEGLIVWQRGFIHR